ncbi:glycoside hydrolase family 15 protein [Microbacterium lacticum]
MTPRALAQDQIQLLADHSLTLITELQTDEGAYPASPSFSAYVGYSWLRDGAFIADGVSAAGAIASASRFFDWCARTLLARTGQIDEIVRATASGMPPSGEKMLPARFTFSGDDGTDDWWDFQLDGYGTWIWALSQHLERHDLDGSPYHDAVAVTIDYLLASWQRPCYDWWEEHAQHTHISTLACIAAGFEATLRRNLVSHERAARVTTELAALRARLLSDGVQDGHLIKWIGGTAVDGSLASAIAPLGVIEPTSSIARRTIDVLESHLTVNGGTHRYLGDTFFGGGQWPLLSCFLGLAHDAAGDRTRANELFEWAAATATTNLDLPEQVDDHLIAPGMRQEWIDRWGTVATPLLWSHAMFLRLGIQLGRIDTQQLTANHERTA